MANQNWSQQREVMLARLRKEFATSLPGPGGKDVLQVPKYLRGFKPSLFNPQIISLVSMRPELGSSMKVSFYRIFFEWYAQVHEEFDHVNVRSLSPFNTASKGTPTEHFVEKLQLSDKDVSAASDSYRLDSTAAASFCYRFDSTTLIKQFLAMDAIFLVLFLRYSYHHSSNQHLKLPENVHEAIHHVPAFRPLAESPAIWRDVFLIENQIPMHIVKKVWLQMPDKCDSEGAEEELNCLLREILKDQYRGIWTPGVHPSGPTTLDKVLNKKDFSGECDHLLDGLHYLVSFIPEEVQQEDNGAHGFVNENASPSPADVVPSASRLRRVGIKIKADCTFVHEIRFESGLPLRSPVLHLPRLRVAEHTEAILRNLAVFEMLSCQRLKTAGHRQAVLIPFLILMDKLIQSKGDVRVLTKEDNIVGCLGSNKELVSIWKTVVNRLRSSRYQNSRWDKTIDALMERYNSWPRQLSAEFRTKYFARPWVVVSWVAAVLLLVLTGLQTLFTILAYNKAQSLFYPGPAQTPSQL